jgi:hypothetical protein
MPKKFKPTIAPRVCENCQNIFTPSRYWQKFCSRACSTRAFWKRKLQEPEPHPLDALIPDTPPDGPSEAQQAEQERRADIASSRELLKTITNESLDVAQDAISITKKESDLTKVLEGFNYMQPKER